MSADVQHPSWCSPTRCDVHDGGVHNGDPRELTPTGLGWSSAIEIYPSWAPAQDGYPAEDPGVYLFASGEGPLTADEARRLAALLVEAADTLEGSGVGSEA